jgi:hypothetical protein
VLGVDTVGGELLVGEAVDTGEGLGEQSRRESRVSTSASMAMSWSWV